MKNLRKLRKKKIFISCLLFLLITTFTIPFINLPFVSADGESWLEGWNYRKSHLIYNSSDVSTNWNISINVHKDITVIDDSIQSPQMKSCFYYNYVTYFAYLSGTSIYINTWNHTSQELGTPVVLWTVSDGIAEDGHSCPSLHVIQTGINTGKIIVSVGRQEMDLRVKRSTATEDISSWDTQVIVDVGNNNYPNLWELANGTLYLFVRYEHQYCRYYYSNDSGGNWSSGVDIGDFGNDDYWFYHFQAVTNTEIHIASWMSNYTSGSEDARNVYYAYYNGSSWMKRDGTELSLPFNHTTMDLVYETDTAKMNRVTDLQIDSSGNPFILVNDNYTDTVSEVDYHYYSEGSWTHDFVTTTHVQLSGNTGGEGCIDYNNQSTIYVGANVNNHNEMQEWHKSEDSWSMVYELTINSSTTNYHNVRPQSIKNASNLKILWASGIVTSFNDFNTDVYLYGTMGQDAGDTCYVPIEKIQSTFVDIRWTDNDGTTLLLHELNTPIVNTGHYAVFDVCIADYLSSDNVTIYMYYGNATATDESISITPSRFGVTENFEDGDIIDTPFNYYKVGTPVVTSDEPYEGTYSLRLDGNERAGSENGTFWDESQETITYYAQVANEATSTSQSFATFIASSGNYKLIFIIRDDQTIDLWYDGSTHEEVGTYVVGTWYKIEFELDLGTSKFNVTMSYTNETVVYSDVNLDMGSFSSIYNDVTFQTSSSWSGTCYVDYVYSGTGLALPVQNGWNVEEEYSTNNTPANGSASISDMDDSNNLYAQLSSYTATSTATDDDGYADIAYMEFSLKQGESYRVTFRYTEDTTTFSTEIGSSEWTLDDSSSAENTSATELSVTWIFFVQWDATEESNLNVEITVYDAEASDTDTAQSSYCDVITSLVTDNFNTNDGRINLGEETILSGNVYYANNPSSSIATTYYPPDSEFTSVDILDSSETERGSDETIINGAFSSLFNIPSDVQLNTYHVYLDMADVDYTDANAGDGDTVEVIGDRIKILTLNLTDSRINANDVDTSTLYSTAELEYDNHALEDVDSIVISGATLTWNAGDSRFEGVLTSGASVTSTTYDTFTSGSEATYGITVGNMDSNTATLIYDKLQVTEYTISDSRTSINDYVQIDVTLIFDYDDAECTTGTITINSESATHQGSGVYRINVTSATVQGVTFDTVACSAESTYDITTVDQNSQSQLAIWDRILIGFVCTDSTPFNLQVVGFNVTLTYDYDDTTVESYTYDINKNDELFQDNLSTNTFIDYDEDETHTYDFVSLTESTYGITAFADPSNLEVTWSGEATGEGNNSPYWLIIAGIVTLFILLPTVMIMLRKK